MNKAHLTVKDYVEGVVSGSRIILARAITLVESTRPEDQRLAAEVIEQLLPHTGNAVRIGITGTPGVGKSTFIESFGEHVTQLEKKIAVLTIDPSSSLTRGSILGDKTRMERLSKNARAFIRPSASGAMLGGVAAKTREAMLLCEAAGFDIIVVETVGVGQSETAVRNMVDFFLLLMLAGAGDELQGIKKGIVEMADAIAITKAEGDNLTRAKEAQAEYAQALHLLPPARSGWIPSVRLCSALNNTGVAEIFALILEHRDKTIFSGYWEQNRKAQSASWFREHFEQLLKQDFRRFASLRKFEAKMTERIEGNELSPYKAAFELLDEYHRQIKSDQ